MDESKRYAIWRLSRKGVEVAGVEVAKGIYNLYLPPSSVGGERNVYLKPSVCEMRVIVRGYSVEEVARALFALEREKDPGAVAAIEDLSRAAPDAAGAIWKVHAVAWERAKPDVRAEYERRAGVLALHLHLKG